MASSSAGHRGQPSAPTSAPESSESEPEVERDPLGTAGDRLIGLYPIEARERLVQRRNKWLQRGVSALDIEARIAQFAASNGITPTGGPGTVPDPRALQARSSLAALTRPADGDNFEQHKAAILRFINLNGPAPALPIAKAVLGEHAVKSQVNSILYRLREQGILNKSNTKVWSLAYDEPTARVVTFLRDGLAYNAMEIAGSLGIPLPRIRTALESLYATSIVDATPHSTPSGNQLFYKLN